MAQLSVETGGGVALIEDLAAYTSVTLLRIFPTHFTPVTASQYAGNAQMIGEIAYGGRLGNDPAPSTDGFVYRGAGLIQSTGKGNRVQLQKQLTAKNAGFDIVANPVLIVDAKHALECAVAFFTQTGLVSLAQKDCGDCVSYRVNGGTNGILQRRQQLAIWKKELGVAPLTAPGPCPPVPGAPPQTS
jgi:putative chitinase